MKDKIEQKTIRAKNLIYRYNNLDKNRFNKQGDLDVDWIIANIFNKKCIYCGETKWEKLGCDRIDNDLHHTKDNCVCSCRRCNMLRGNLFTVEEMKKIGKVIRKIEVKRKKDKKKELERLNKKSRKGTKVAKISIKTGKILKIYDSIISVTADGFERNGVGKACNNYGGRSDIYKGFKWKKIN